MTEEKFLRFVEELEPLWQRMGVKKMHAKKAIEERRLHWGIGQEVGKAAPVSQDRKALLKKLEAHLGSGKKEHQ
jgi:hypothetical protein